MRCAQSGAVRDHGRGLCADRHRQARARACGCSTSAPKSIKGTDDLQRSQPAAAEATGLAMQFEGFVEADKINRGEVDVVVTDGFSGNIALKAIEGSARFVTDLLKTAFTSARCGPRSASSSPPGDRIAAPPSRSEQPQRRGVPRPQRGDREIARQRQCARAWPTQWVAARDCWRKTSPPASPPIWRRSGMARAMTAGGEATK